MIVKDCGPDSPFPTFREKLAVNLWRCPFFSERQLLARERRNKQTMGQKREQTIEVEFTEADKECLVRLVKELVAKGAEGDKVRSDISRRQKVGSPQQTAESSTSPNPSRRATSRHGSRRRRRER